MTLAYERGIQKMWILNVGEQVDTPQNLYEKPCNLFVAGFMGAPQMNFINATIVRAGEDYGISFGKYTITLPESKNKNNILSKFVGRDVILGIRPEDVHDDPEFLEKATDIGLKNLILVICKINPVNKCIWYANHSNLMQ